MCLLMSYITDTHCSGPQAGFNFPALGDEVIHTRHAIEEMFVSPQNAYVKSLLPA